MANKKTTRKPARSTVDSDAIRAELTALWQNTDGGKAFIAAVQERGYLDTGAESGTPNSEHRIASPPEGRYEAFRLYKRTRKLYRLGLRPVERAWERVVYSHLTRIGEDGLHGKALTLVFSNFMVVIIRGRNLQPIANAIDLEICEYVQQFNPNRWQAPDDDKAPFVESMEFLYPTTGKSAELKTPTS